MTSGTLDPSPTNTGSGTPLTGEIVRMDKLAIILDANPLFAEAIRLSKDQDFTGSIDLLNKIKQTSTSIDEKAIADFNISFNKFSLDRMEGAMSYIDLAKDTTYPPRIRALAMQRIYLMYRKYSDIDILKKAVESI